MNKKAALIETGGSHEECLYSQILFLNKAGFETDIICSYDIKERVSQLSSSASIISFHFGKGFFNDFKNLLRIRKHLIGNKIQKVILNSADGTRIRNLLVLPYPKEIEFTGIIHDAERIIRSGNQKFINRKIKKYLVLSDYVLDYIKSLKLRQAKFESFYPIFQPDYSSAIHKPEDEFWVCIPGRVEQKRRDYKTLLEQIERLSPAKNVKIILLGKADDHLRPLISAAISKFKSGKLFILFENFINNDVFYSYVRMSDIILPLIHPGEKWFDKYSRTQISGSYTMAYTYKIPMLCESSFINYEDFRDTSFFYDKDNLVNMINELATNREYYLSEKSKMYKLPKWDFEYQFRQYINFIEL